MSTRFAWQSLFSAVLVPLCASCVTINVYFPSAAAEQAADKVIDQVWGAGAKTPSQPESSTGNSQPVSFLVLNQNLIASIADFVVPGAQAQSATEADLNVSTAGIRALTSAMQTRFEQLRPYLDQGWIGLTNDGLVAVVTPSKVPLDQRTKVNSLIDKENSDRKSLYSQIAEANGHPEWADNIRDVFAKRWLARAQPGWMVQDTDGKWMKR